MNKDRRKRLTRACELLATAQTAFDEAKEIVSECASEEREGFDNLSEGLQSSERGERMSETADALENLENDMDNVDFQEFISTIEQGCE